MARQTDAYRSLKKIIHLLGKELDSESLPAARRRTVQKQYLQAALSMSKLEQWQARSKSEARKSAPAPAKARPKTIEEQWLENLDSEIESARNVLGTPEQKKQDT